MIDSQLVFGEARDYSIGAGGTEQLWRSTLFLDAGYLERSGEMVFMVLSLSTSLATLSPLIIVENLIFLARKYFSKKL
jgi:hypothetical protein